MAFTWHPFARPELDGEGYVVSQLTTGLFYRVSGPIVELLSQMPFEDFRQATDTWRRRTGASEADSISLEKTWRRLCAAGLVVVAPDGIAHAAHMPPLVLSHRASSRLDRFVEMQDFLEDESDEGAVGGPSWTDAVEGPDPHDPYGH